MSGIQLHPRWRITSLAHNELDKYVCDIVEKHGLTYGELFNILGQILCSWSKWQVKDERKS